MPERAMPGQHSPLTDKRGTIVGRYPSNTEHEGLHWGHVAVGVFWGFILSLLFALAANWFVNRNAPCDLSNWHDDFEDD
jgi:hypothetical protein